MNRQYISGSLLSLPRKSGDFAIITEKDMTLMRKHLNPLLCVVALAAMLTNAHAQGWFTNGLVAYYPFDGTANDASGSGNNGTVSSAVLAGNRFGVANSAYSFNGSNAFVVVPDSSSLNPSAITVAGWFWLNTAPTNNQEAFCVSKYAVFRGWLLKVDSAMNVGFSVAKLPSTSVYAIASNAMPIKTWVHLAGTYDGQTVTVFVNGQLAGTTAYAGGYTQSGNYMKIGTATHTTGGWFNGSCDDVRIYNRALSPSEVAQMFSVEAGSLNVRKAVYLDNLNLTVGSNYQLQVSADLQNWANHGATFTATNSYWRSTNYWNVDDWEQLFFRLKPQ